MKLINTLKKYWYLIITILIVCALIPLYYENISKALVISIAIIIWCILGILFKKFTLSSLLILFLILPFNITYQLPYSFLGITLSDPFVNGVIVNYMIPTISVLDLGVFLLLLSMFFENILILKWKGFSFLKVFIVFTIYLVIQNIAIGEFLTLFNSLRLIFYLFTFYQLSLNIKDLLRQRVLVYILILSLLLVLFQGIVALIQFSGGTSLGIYFLGESHVVSGMMGSSFLTLNNQLYLRGYGTFPHPNVFSGWLIFNIFLGWYLFESMERKRDYSIILMIISSLVMVLTFSRVGYLVTGIVWVVFLGNIFVRINTKKQKRSIKNAKTKEYGMIGLVGERVMNLVGGGDTSWSDRVGLMKASFSIIKDNLLMGVGLGRFVSNMGDLVPRSSNGILLLQPVHNIFLLLISEVGIIGFGLFSTLLYFFLEKKKFTVRFITLLICLFVIGMFDHYMISLGQGWGLLFFLLMI
jgi:hypothetical protein